MVMSGSSNSALMDSPNSAHMINFASTTKRRNNTTARSSDLDFRSTHGIALIVSAKRRLVNIEYLPLISRATSMVDESFLMYFGALADLNIARFFHKVA
ncbi:unnamed protein product [Lasius platythorax]|uniref:Uncharacterized protein n=1 Tax=Lasius platythorax TaxID=488582 RepID=A0AAV2P8Y3_9HYME